MKRLLGVQLVILALVFAFGAVGEPFSDVRGFSAFGPKFLAAVGKGDGATVRSLCVETEAQRIWEAMEARQLDKAKRIWLRHESFKEAGDSYYEWVADMSDGSSSPFRVDVVNDSRRGWLAKSVKFEK